MNILALDTASTTCSVAALVNGEIVAERVDASGETHSRHLMTLVDAVVVASIGHVGGFDGFAVTRGPGSFTGLRIGISAVKGLAVAAGKPVVGISSLKTLAAQVGEVPALICPLLDARRNEVYCAGFRRVDGRLERVRPESALAPEAAVDGIDEDCLLIGDGVLRYRERLLGVLGSSAAVADDDCHSIRASVLARLAIDAFADGRGMEPAALVPTYIRGTYVDRKRWHG